MHGAKLVLVGTLLVGWLGSSQPSSTAAPQRIDLAAQLTAGKLHAVNREVTKGQGRPDAVHVSEKANNGLVWIDGTDFADGTIEVDIRGRDLMQRSFVGIAFHGKDD